MKRKTKVWVSIASVVVILIIGEGIVMNHYHVDPSDYAHQTVNGYLKDKNWDKIKQLSKGDTKLYKLLKKNGKINFYDQPDMGDYDYNSYPGRIKHTTVDVGVELKSQPYGPFNLFKRYRVTYIARTD